MPGALKPLTTGLGPGRLEAVFINSVIIETLLARTRQAVDASRKNAFVAHLRFDPNGILNGAYHGIPTRGKFFDAEEAATSTLGLTEEFIAENWYGFVRSVIAELCLRDQYEIKIC